jgi:hypothetical protein
VKAEKAYARASRDLKETESSEIDAMNVKIFECALNVLRGALESVNDLATEIQDGRVARYREKNRELQEIQQR